MTAVVQRVAEWHRIAAGIRREEVLGLVPTMGALHEGHGALLEEARKRCSIVAASIFVNPIQFNQKSDYDLYPRVLEEDVAFCAARGVDYIFAPSDDEMYPEPQRVFVEVGDTTEHLCGRSRPGHFRGVATAVMKLFQILRPQFAFFGEKDYQQLAIVRRLVRDLNVPVEVVGVPTVRETDGLALSSRNRRLNAAERSLAPCLYTALLVARQLIACGERNAAAIKERAIQVLQGVPQIRLDYFELVDPDTIRPVDVVESPVRAATAIWIGETRLIDNVYCEPRLHSADGTSGALRLTQGRGDRCRLVGTGFGLEASMAIATSPESGGEESCVDSIELGAASQREMPVRTTRVSENVLRANREIAQQNQARLDAAGVAALNLMAFPGAGKSSLIERTIQSLGKRLRIGVINGDTSASAMYAERAEKAGAIAVHINTAGKCHLDAGMVRDAMARLPLQDIDLLLIENVGNLICPSSWQLGSHCNVLIASTPEGHDKPYKFPRLYRGVDAVVINKIDLLPYVSFDLNYFKRGVEALNSGLLTFPLSCFSGLGLNAWSDWVESAVSTGYRDVRQRALAS